MDNVDDIASFVGLAADVADIRRLDHTRQLMSLLGLVPSEYSSGPSVRHGGITKAGSPHAQRLLAEAAWAYQGVARIGRQMLYRQEALPKTVSDIACKARLGSSRAGDPRAGRRHRYREASGIAPPPAPEQSALIHGGLRATMSSHSRGLPEAVGW